MALQGNQAEEQAQRDHLVSIMASLGLGVGEQESSAAAAAVVPLSGQELESSLYDTRFCWEGAAAVARLIWGGHVAPTGCSAHGRRVGGPYAYAPTLLPVEPSSSARRYGGEGGRAVGRRNQQQRAATFPARPGGVLCGGHGAYLPPFLHGGGAAPVVPQPYPLGHEQQALFVQPWHGHGYDPVDDMVSHYAYNLLMSADGQQPFCHFFTQCQPELQTRILATITEDKNSFWRICGNRSHEVVHMIENSCESPQSLLLLREAMLPWMEPHHLMNCLLTNQNRIRVVLAFIKHSPPDFVQFIFEAVSENCTSLACRANGLSLLQGCLLSHGIKEEKDDIFTKISYDSFYLSQNSNGNYIVQDVLKEGNPWHHATIASCFRNNYVELSRHKYSSNVVEQCLRVFDESERGVIVHELISDPYFRDLVTHEYANFVISTALRTCKYRLRHDLATAIISKNISYRNQHCLKIFSLLAKLGYE